MSPIRCARATISCALILLFASPALAMTLYAIGGNAGHPGGMSGLYTVDAGTGVMGWVGSLHVGANYDNTLYSGGLAYDPYADRLYAIGCDGPGGSALFVINPADASMTRIGDCFPANQGAFCGGSLAFDLTTGRLFALGDLNQPPYQRTSLVEIDTGTGAATFVGDNGSAGTYLKGLGCDPRSGILYANGFQNWDQSSGSGLFVLDKGSGAATLVGYHGLSMGRQMYYSGLAVNPVTGVAYGFGSSTASQNDLYTVSLSSGAVTSVGPESPNGVGVDGGLAYVGTDILDVRPAALASAPLRAWPNPAHAGVTFSYSLLNPGNVSLSLYDLAGRRVAVLNRTGSPAGTLTIEWDGADERGRRVGAGLYFATLRADGVVAGRTSVRVAR